MSLKAENQAFLDDGIRGPMLANLLKYAVGRAIQCPDCGDILDYRRAVLFTPGNRGAGISCGECWDRTVKGLEAKHGAERITEYFESLPAEDLVDGRKLT